MLLLKLQVDIFAYCIILCFGHWVYHALYYMPVQADFSFLIFHDYMYATIYCVEFLHIVYFPSTSGKHVRAMNTLLNPTFI